MNSIAWTSIKWGKDTWTITLVVLLVETIILAILAWRANAYWQLGKPTITYILAVSATLMIGSNVLALLLAPRRVGIAEDRLLIDRWGPGVIGIKFSDVRSLSVRTDGFRGATRRLGSGGLFGFFGKFDSATLGHFSAYAGSATGEAIAIETKSGERFLIGGVPVNQIENSVGRHRGPS